MPTPRAAPYVIVSCAVSVDGYLDDTSPRRLILSNAEDLDRVDEVRASCDAILVGAETVRRDDPRLRIRSPDRRAARVAEGLPADPLRVTVTATGRLDRSARFFGGGPETALVYAPAGVVPATRDAVADVATVVGPGEPVELGAVLADLAGRGVRRLLVEGGGRLLARFLTEELVDELQLVIAPFFVGDPAAPRVAGAGRFPHDADRPMELVESRRLDDRVLLVYRLTSAVDGLPDRGWLREAVNESRNCPPAPTAYSVGAIVVGADGRELARGHSREETPYDHAEEVALRRLGVPGMPGTPVRKAAGATIYTSLEPCGERKSRPRTCVDLIRAAGVHRVVFAWREPSLFVEGRGAERLRAAGIEVVELPELAEEARRVNAHLLG